MQHIDSSEVMQNNESVIKKTLTIQLLIINVM